MGFKIISFDSDGIGAVGSALLLHRLDPKGDLVRSADMFAGNAFGAVTALALASGVNLGELIEAFKANAASYFAVPGSSTRYDQSAMARTLAKLFGAARLSELPLSGPKVMINLDRLEDPQGDVWHTHAIGNGRRERFADMLLSDLAISACSAHGFFEPHCLQPMDHPARGKFRSAETSEINPAADAMTYAEEHFGVDQADIHLISIGRSGGDQFPKAKVLASEGDRDMRTWAWPFSRISRSLRGRGGLSKVDSNCRISALGDRYQRLEYACDLPIEFDSWQSIDALLEMAEQQCAESAWKAQASNLQANWKVENDFALIAKPGSRLRKLR